MSDRRGRRRRELPRIGGRLCQDVEGAPEAEHCRQPRTTEVPTPRWNQTAESTRRREFETQIQTFEIKA